jgi:hypothetical protein
MLTPLGGWADELLRATARGLEAVIGIEYRCRQFYEYGGGARKLGRADC